MVLGRKILSGLILVLMGLRSLAGQAAPVSEVRLLLAPPFLRLELRQPELQVAAGEVQVQILAPPQRPWRLLVQLQGPPQALEGLPLPEVQWFWQGRLGGCFREGCLTGPLPQVCAQGQGPASGVVRLEGNLPPTSGAGRWRQRFLFWLETP